MVTTRTPPRASASPQQPGRPAQVDIRPPGRRVRVPELAVGVLVTVVFALGAALWHLSSVDKVPALAAATTIERGDTIESGDVKVVYIASDGAVNRMDGSQLGRVVGRVALVDVGKGTLLTPSLMAGSVAINDGDGVVGLSLEPGAYPASGLAKGDRVNIVLTADFADGGEDPTVIARGAVVFGVEELTSGRRLVSILTNEVDAEAVAAAAGGDVVRLVLVAP